MYIKDSVIEAQIEKDLKKEKLKGRIEEVEHQLSTAESDARGSGLKKRLKKLRGDLKLLSE